MAMIRTALLYFDQAVKDGSIRKAADNLHVASSAVNRQLLQLEHELGVELFVRLPRGIRATAAGEAVLGYVRRWNREAIALKQEIGGLRGGIRGTIRIAAAESLTEQVLPHAMSALQVRFPLVDFSLISGDNYRITSELLAKEADIVLAYDAKASRRADIIYTITSDIGVVTTLDHPLSKLDRISLADCAAFPIIAPGDDWLRHSGLEDLFAQDATARRVVARAERPGMLKSLVRAGLGIAFLSSLGVKQDVEEGKLAWTPMAPGIVKPSIVALMIARGKSPSIYTSVFIEILKEELRNLQES
ncbi:MULTISPECIES: LysR family transcriptional regulator [Sphingomonadales]|uniref:HTH-type transcriptional regulator GltC n=1 Tax=Edaphosphingomonas haloaromaticamans TaxID=653954 RepID=A0A1S1HA13_9SPHN|nr:LysR family transcriptional regulator [Sphingomonas haloaromaticamans]OHT18672.1 HTH-type transcriptional regulator GltC [Sphingomonas haloaromaticamans]